MNLYVLGRKLPSYQLGHKTYDQSISFVIRASSPKKAREIAASPAQSGGEGSEVWLDPEKSSCKKLTPSGIEWVIVRDFHEE